MYVLLTRTLLSSFFTVSLRKRKCDVVGEQPIRRLVMATVSINKGQPMSVVEKMSNLRYLHLLIISNQGLNKGLVLCSIME